MINSTIFKNNWEKSHTQHHISSDLIIKMIRSAYPSSTLMSYEIIAGGCANLNIKIKFAKNELNVVLRIYLRDKTSVYREQKIGELLKQTIHVPQIYYIGEISNYLFAITEFIPGISLRDLLLGNLLYDMEKIMYKAGSLLANINSYKFSNSGFFDKNLNILKPITRNEYLVFAKDCLKNNNVLSQITSKEIDQINYLLRKYEYLLPDGTEKNLVHADFEPANIFVEEQNNDWNISGVLDWEFAFSGSILCDVANMLRYAHKMPSIFEKSFLQGLQLNRKLPDNWRTSIHLLNLLSLLDCLARSDIENRSNQCHDIQQLIKYILSQFLNH